MKRILHFLHLLLWNWMIVISSSFSFLLFCTWDNKPSHSLGGLTCMPPKIQRHGGRIKTILKTSVPTTLLQAHYISIRSTSLLLLEKKVCFFNNQPKLSSHGRKNQVFDNLNFITTTEAKIKKKKLKTCFFKIAKSPTRWNCEKIKRR